MGTDGADTLFTPRRKFFKSARIGFALQTFKSHGTSERIFRFGRPKRTMAVRVRASGCPVIAVQVSLIRRAKRSNPDCRRRQCSLPIPAQWRSHCRRERGTRVPKDEVPAGGPRASRRPLRGLLSMRETDHRLGQESVRRMGGAKQCPSITVVVVMGFAEGSTHPTGSTLGLRTGQQRPRRLITGAK